MIKIFLSLVVLWLSPELSRADEVSERAEIRAAAFTAFVNSDFKSLDDAAQDYRRNAARLPSGVWKLSFFYLGVSDRATWNQKDPLAWRQLEEETEQWVASNPQSATAVLVRAMVLENHAWSFRGTGPGGRVAEEDMKVFAQLMEVARDFLLAHKTVGAKDPHWYTSMVRILTGLEASEDSVMAVVDEAMQSKPCYYQTLFAAVDYFSPKWGRKAADLERYVRLVTERTRSEEGMALYARIYWAATESWYASQVWPQLNWPDFRRGVFDVLAHYPDEWNYNAFARFACAGRDITLAADMFQHVHAPQPQLWRSKQDFDACRAWALSGSSPQGTRGL